MPRLTIDDIKSISIAEEEIIFPHSKGCELCSEYTKLSLKARFQAIERFDISFARHLIELYGIKIRDLRGAGTTGCSRINNITVI